MHLDQSTVKTQYRQQTGLSLIEILVTLFILSVALLGLAALQNTSIKLSYNAYLRTQASFLAYDLIERIRANSDAPKYIIGFDATPASKDCFQGDTCTVNDMRTHDLYFWKKRVNALLPDAKAEVTYDGTQLMYTMRINWQDRIKKSASQNSETKNFTYSFQVRD